MKYQRKVLWQIDFKVVPWSLPPGPWPLTSFYDSLSLSVSGTCDLLLTRKTWHKDVM